ncbi:Uncharacterised protein [Mycobacteroides abscessus subsp. abscessus]|nr:Uncharacterised protein [Mycobacteroides abscessus subsp. abscessus]
MIQAASSEARKPIRRATSSGLPSRFIGYTLAARSSSAEYSASANLVLTTPGATALTRIFGPSCQASSSVSRIRAALDAP